MRRGQAGATARPQSRRDSNQNDLLQSNHITRKIQMTNTDPSVVYCDECWEPITDETFYIFGFGKGHALSDEIICENCLRRNHMQYLADFVEERKDMASYGDSV